VLGALLTATQMPDNLRKFRDLVMAVNLSPRQFRHPRLVQDVGQVLAESGLDEKILEKLLETGVGTIERLGSMTPEQLEEMQGIGLAIDDFGTGVLEPGLSQALPHRRAQGGPLVRGRLARRTAAMPPSSALSSA
jgi:EAL domain-containing protein (putative c-di-GMP-specific phosphodiesterase class I)